MIMGTTEASQDISFPAMAELQQKVAAIVLADPAVATLGSFIGGGRGQFHGEQRPHVHHVETARGTQSQRGHGHQPPAPATLAGRRHQPVPASGAGHPRRRAD